MQYMGGKSRIAKEISAILNEVDSDNFVSLFCGTCSIESLVKFENKFLNDSHSYLIQMFKDLQSGREFPSNISEEEYKSIKTDMNSDKGLSGFVGFGCSFGGKWWGGGVRSSNKWFKLRFDC